MLIIAVIGHNRIIEPIVNSIKSNFADIETIKIEFIDMEMKNAAIEYLKSQMNKIDGIVYTGRIPYEIVNICMDISIPQVYIRHDSSVLMQTLLEAEMNENYDIKKVSCDSYSLKDMLSVYKGFGLAENQLMLKTAPKIKPDNMIAELYDFHKNSYEGEEISFCITGISKVFEKLAEENIPVFLLRPTAESVKSGLKELISGINAIADSESQIVVISMEIDLPGEYNLVHENEYRLMLEKTRVTEQVYMFAEKIQAAVVEVGAHNYLLFSTRKIFEAATSQSLSLPVLKAVNENSVHTLSVGVGYGKTAREAKHNAALGLNRALLKGGNQAYLVNEGAFSSPIYPDENNGAGENTITNPLFTVISEKTGISINNIYRFHYIKEKTKKDCFTSAELAEEFGNTRRSINRIIEKLESAGYAKIEGTRMMSDTGRPTRIIRLNF